MHRFGFVFLIGLLLSGGLVRAACATVTIPIQGAADTSAREQAGLEREKFEFEKRMEQERLAIEQRTAISSGLAVFLPLLLGVITLGWQTRVANKLKDREARDAFEMKAAEIVFIGDNTVATKNRAKALTVLFPNRFPENFGDAFEPTQFGGPRFDAKVEVFRAACSKVNTPDEVYQIWYEIFPADKWILPLVGKGDGGESGGSKDKA